MFKKQNLNWAYHVRHLIGSASNPVFKLLERRYNNFEVLGPVQPTSYTIKGVEHTFYYFTGANSVAEEIPYEPKT